MNLKRFQTFLVLSREKNFTKTAAVLGIAQSGVTAQIQQLEASFGVQLFERIGKCVSLTQEGEKLLPYAKKMLFLYDEISALYQNPGQITIGITESIASYLFGNILKEYAALYSETEIFLKILENKDYCQMLSCGEIDLAIVLDAAVKNKSIRILQKRKEPIILAASFTHGLSGRTQITPEDFARYPLLLPLPGCSYRRLFEQKLHSEGIRFKTALETDAVSLIKESVLCGIGLGLLPEFAVKKELIYHMIEKLNYKTDYPVYTQILVHPDKYISPDLKNFLKVAERHLA